MTERFPHTAKCFPQTASCGPCFDGCGWCARQPRVRLTTPGRFVRRHKPCLPGYHPYCPGPFAPPRTWFAPPPVHLPPPSNPKLPETPSTVFTVPRRGTTVGTLGQQQELKTGIPKVDAFFKTPVGKALIVGGIGMGAAKAFPGKTVAPFVLSALAGIMSGVIPDVRGQKIL